jgi:hypothetical protein
MFACVLVLALVACGDIQEEGITVVFDDETAGTISHGLTNGSPDAVGLLAFLNDAETSFETLDIDARLDKRSASGLIHHRNGPDGVYGTWDDNRFDSVDEVDAVKWVGVKTIARILGYAADLGFVPQVGDVLGVYDTVSFTVLEADDVLNFANEVSFEGLDAILNVRAVRSIVAARPFASIEELASARYVGRRALETMKAAAVKVHGSLQAQQR